MTSPALLCVTAGNTVPSASSSFAIAHVKVSVPAGNAVGAYGAVSETWPSDALLLEKNAYVTVDVLRLAVGSNAICGVNVVPDTIALQLSNFAGAFGCDATVPTSVVGLCAKTGPSPIPRHAITTPAKTARRAFVKLSAGMKKISLWKNGVTLGPFGLSRKACGPFRRGAPDRYCTFVIFRTVLPERSVT
jgi:hypothetical protein